MLGMVVGGQLTKRVPTRGHGKGGKGKEKKHRMNDYYSRKNLGVSLADGTHSAGYSWAV